MREKEERDLEKLKYIDDYFIEFAKLEDASNIIAPEILDEINRLLSKALKQKYKYIIKYSSSYRRGQSLVSKINDYLATKKEKQMQKVDKPDIASQDKPSPAQLASPPLPALSDTQQKVEVLDSETVKQIPQNVNENPQEET